MPGVPIIKLQSADYAPRTETPSQVAPRQQYGNRRPNHRRQSDTGDVRVSKIQPRVSTDLDIVGALFQCRAFVFRACFG